MKRITHWIDDRPYETRAERQGDVYDPATGKVTGRVAYASVEVVDAAVESAQRAFPEWRDTSLTERARILFAFRDLVQSQRDELAGVITAEHGKVLADAAGEVARGLDVVDFACGIPHLLKGEFSENVSTSLDTYSIRQPLGVVAGITPFNFPVMVPMWMFPIAIASGNTFVLKPSEKDPSAANLLAGLLAEAGLPAGVFNVVHGDKLTVDRLLEHPDVRAISSVGSTPVARYIYENAARAGKRVQALGGAKNHMVVLEDADMDAAADALVASAYGSAGERCMAISAAVAVGAAGDALIDKVKQRVTQLRMGPGTDPAAQMGPLVTEAHRDKVLSYIETGVREGAELVIDGRGVTVAGCENGYFLGPCLFDHVTADMTVYRDELFGPVLVLLRVADFDDAIALVNDNPFGNGTALFTASGAAARKFQHEIEVGMVGINIPIPVPLAFYSFGGWKDSLFGDTHIYGPDGVRFYTRTKVITARWPKPPTAEALTFPTS